ncbi:MAG TPA: hypothetical protein VFR75_09955 [Solirubrobacterales bacterium]|nr:hypothetical protein [Solirubrobacterales bacterium]
MKYVKILGLLAVAAAAPMAFAGTAMATTVTTTTGGAAATPTIHLVNWVSHLTLLNPVANISCASTVELAVEKHGGSATAKGNLAKLTFTGCTNGWHVTAISNGSLEMHHLSGHNGLVTSSGTKIDATRLGITCVYETSNTTLGMLYGGAFPLLELEASVPINHSESSSLCGVSDAHWDGAYQATSALYVAP